MKKITMILKDNVLENIFLGGVGLTEVIGRTDYFCIEDVEEAKVPALNKPPREVLKEVAKRARTKSRKTPKTHRYAVDAILGRFTKEGDEFSSQDAKKWLRNAGFSEGSVAKTLSQLTKSGCIKRIEKGRYQFLKNW